VRARVFPPDPRQLDLLATVGWLGVLSLLIVTGLETDVRVIRRRGRTALLTSLGGVTVTLITGFLLGLSLPDAVVADPDQRLVLAMFMAVAMSITALPVIAHVLWDLGILQRDTGQLVLAAAMLDDTIGWLLLSIVASLATHGAADPAVVGVAVAGAVGFALAMATVGRQLFDLLLRVTWAGDPAGQVPLVLVLAFGGAALTGAVGLEPVLGAFVASAVVARSRWFRPEAARHLEVLSGGFVAPIFFASAGLRVDLSALADPHVLAVFGLVLAVACVGKFTGVFLGSWLGGVALWERLALAAGMNARGAMEIVVATIGLSLGVLTPALYAVVVLVAVTTSLMAPPLMRAALARVPEAPEEAERLARARFEAQSFVHGLRRVLLPTRGGEHVGWAVPVLSALRRSHAVDVVVMSATRGAEVQLAEARGAVDRLQVQLRSTGARTQTKVVVTPNPAQTLLREASRGYDLVVVGAPARAEGGRALLGDVVDAVLLASPIPVLVLRPPPPGRPVRPRRVLAPSLGTAQGRLAVEVAATLAAAWDADLVLLHVIAHPTPGRDALPDVAAARREAGRDVVDLDAAVARGLGARVSAEVGEATRLDEGWLQAVEDLDVDLLVVSTEVRRTTGRAFLGHDLEELLARAPCGVAIVSG
jgi:Kef-type K+ transport system membrane component KefB